MILKTKSEEENKARIQELENENLALKSQLKDKENDYKSLKFQMEDFKKKANVGLLEYYEMEINKKDQKIAELDSLLIQKKQEFDFKTREWMDKLEDYKINEKIQKKNEEDLKRLKGQNFDNSVENKRNLNIYKEEVTQ